MNRQKANEIKIIFSLSSEKRDKKGRR